MRRFEFVQGTSAKFWMAGVEGASLVVAFGRLGTAGQRKDRAFPSAEAATRELEKKIAEKLREGYREVPSPAGGAAGDAKAPEAPAAKLDLPPRTRGGKIDAARVQAAVQALAALQGARARRSWALGREVRRARRALSAIGGIDPAADPALGRAFDALMARVVAPAAPERLPLVRALELLVEVDAAAFARAVGETWKAAPASSPAAAALGVLRRQLEALGDPELGLRFGALLLDRPGRGSMSDEIGWARRWRALAPHLEAHIAQRGGSLRGYLKDLDAGGDPHVARRLERMRAA